MKSRQTLFHYAGEIDKLRQEVARLKEENGALLLFKQKTAHELLALVRRLREEKHSQQNVSSQLETLTHELKALRGDQTPYAAQQYFPQADDISL